MNLDYTPLLGVLVLFVIFMWAILMLGGRNGG